MAVHLIGVQDKMANALHNVQQPSSVDQYMTDLKSCSGQLRRIQHLHVIHQRIVPKLTANVPKDICFAITEGNILRFYIPSHCLNIPGIPSKKRCK